jgi:hypothetical protein
VKESTPSGPWQTVKEGSRDNVVWSLLATDVTDDGTCITFESQPKEPDAGPTQGEGYYRGKPAACFVAPGPNSMSKRVEAFSSIRYSGQTPGTYGYVMGLVSARTESVILTFEGKDNQKIDRTLDTSDGFLADVYSSAFRLTAVTAKDKAGEEVTCNVDMNDRTGAIRC